MKIDVGQWLELFKTGDYGHRGTYTTSDLDVMIHNFNERDQVPIVVDSPKPSDPAWGWISELRRNGSVLIGKVGTIHQDLRTALQKDNFGSVSVRVRKSARGPQILSYGLITKNGLWRNEFPHHAFSFGCDCYPTVEFSVALSNAGGGLSYDLAHKV